MAVKEQDADRHLSFMEWGSAWNIFVYILEVNMVSTVSGDTLAIHGEKSVNYTTGPSLVYVW